VIIAAWILAGALVGIPDALPAPAPLAGVEIVERIGQTIPLDVELQDSTGRGIRLREALRGGRPVLLTLAYTRCPMLCDVVVQGLIGALRSLDLRLGRDYDALTISFDPTEEVAAAARKRRTYLEALGRDAQEEVWPFLVGSAEAIHVLTDGLGFVVRAVPRSREIAHPAAAFILTPDGRISRVLQGVGTPARDLRLALVEASAGRTGRTIDRLLLHCYRYDPATHRYGLYVAGVLRGGALVILLSATALLFLRRGSRARRP
jgi:protein SCO1/2